MRRFKMLYSAIPAGVLIQEEWQPVGAGVFEDLAFVPDSRIELMLPIISRLKELTTRLEQDVEHKIIRTHPVSVLATYYLLDSMSDDSEVARLVETFVTYAKPIRQVPV